MGNHYVYSTLASDNAYTNYKPGGGDLHVKESVVVIRGGAGVVDKGQLVTPIGVSTMVDDDELAALELNPVFQTHKKNGHIKVIAKRESEEKVASSMESRDSSAQLVPQDFTAAGKPEPKVAGKATDKPHPSNKPKNR